MPRLSTSQLAKADRLQKAGQTLREIAGELGVSFEAVCLGLYCGNAGWSPSTESDDDVTAGADDGRAGDDSGAVHFGGGGAGGAAGASAEPVAAGAGLAWGEAVAEREAEAAAPPAPAAVAAPGTADQSPAEAVAEVRAAVAADAVWAQAERGPRAEPASSPVVDLAPTVSRVASARTAVAPPRVAATDRGFFEYRLADELGQWLDKTGQKMTRDRSRAWKGVAAQVAVIQKRYPHLKQLNMEPVEDA